MGDSRGSTLVLALMAPALAWSCGGASEKHSGNAAGAGSAQAGSSSTAGTPTTSQGGSAAPSKAGASGKAGELSATGGTPHGGGGQAAGGTAQSEAGAGGDAAGAGGRAWDPELLGFACDSKRCSIGQACVYCARAEGSFRICVPNPASDPAGFEAGTAICGEPRPTSFIECDGPEDCPATRYCVASEGAGNGGMRCRDEPSTVGGSCCFACGALTDCTLCRSSADCPDNVACEPAQSAPAGIMGCKRRP